MAFRASQTSVGTTAVKIVDAVAGDVEAWIEVSTGIVADAVYLGGTNAVTTSTGYRLENTDNSYNVRVRPGDTIWAITTGSGPYTVGVMIRSA